MDPLRARADITLHRGRRLTAMLRLLAVGTVVALVAAGCSSSTEAPPAGGNAEVGTTSDINPQDPGK